MPFRLCNYIDQKWVARMRKSGSSQFHLIHTFTHIHNAHSVYDATKHGTQRILLYVTRYNAILLKVIIIYFMSLLSSPKCVRALRKWWCATRSSRYALFSSTTIRLLALSLSFSSSFFLSSHVCVCEPLSLLLSLEIFHSLNFNCLYVMTKPKTWVKRCIEHIAIRFWKSIPTDKRVIKSINYWQEHE